MVPEKGLEPSRHLASHFKCETSSYSVTPTHFSRTFFSVNYFEKQVPLLIKIIHWMYIKSLCILHKSRKHAAFYNFHCTGNTAETLHQNMS